MSLGIRDNEAFELLGARRFDGASLVGLDLDMQTQRLTLRVYGKLHGGVGPTHVASIAFFGIEAFAITSNDAFPERAGIETFELTHDHETDTSTAAIAGVAGWTIAFRFDGVSFEETPATIASLADET